MNIGGEQLMATEFELCDREKIVIVRCLGVVTAESCEAGFAQYAGSVTHPVHYNFLVDFSQAEAIEMSFQQMMSMSFRRNALYKSWGPTRMAFLAPETPIFAMARMYAAAAHRADLLEAQAFRDRDEAMAFLAAEASSK